MAGQRHGDWIGMMLRALVAENRITSVALQFVRHNDRNETVPCRLADERAEFADIRARSAQYTTRFVEYGDEVIIEAGREVGV